MKDKIKIATSILSLSLLFTACNQSQLFTQKSNHLKKFNYSPLHTAVRLNNYHLVKDLLNKKDIDVKDNFGDTPLIDSIRNNSTSISKLLLCYGAKTDIIDNNGLSLIDIATRNQNTDIIAMLSSDDINKYCIKEKKEEEVNNELFDNTAEVLLDLNSKVGNKDDNTNTNANDANVNSTEEVIPYNESTKEISEIPLYSNSANNLTDSLEEVILNDNIIYDKNNFSFLFKEGELNGIMKNDLSFFMTQLNTIIKNNKDSIKGIIISTYTSSEYRTKKTLLEKAKANKKLSQKRADKIKSYILSLSEDKYWLSKHLDSIGNGSENLIYDQYGIEDKDKSKRTIIKIITE